MTNLNEIFKVLVIKLLTNKKIILMFSKKFRYTNIKISSRFPRISLKIYQLILLALPQFLSSKTLNTTFY